MRKTRKNSRRSGRRQSSKKLNGWKKRTWTPRETGQIRDPGSGFLDPESFTLEDGILPFKVTIHTVTGPPEDALQEFKDRIFRMWLDDPDPELGDLTPRAAARSEVGRVEVLARIRELELMDRVQSTEESRYDFGPLRRELGLELG